MRFGLKAARRLLALGFSLLLALSITARAEAPFSFDTAPGRLPKDVVPKDYHIAIVPDVKALTIAGAESVTLAFRKSSATIQFNSLNEKLDNVIRAADSYLQAKSEH